MPRDKSSIIKIECVELLDLKKYPIMKSFLLYGDPVLDIRYNSYFDDDSEMTFVDISEEKSILICG